MHNTTNDKLIIYIGPVEVPGNTAGARRILGNAKAFQHAGYDVMIGGAQTGNGGYTEHEGITIYATGERRHENLPKWLRYLAYVRMGKDTIAWLNTIDQPITAVILYSGYSPYLLRLLPWCRKRNIPLVFDAVEWYEAPSKMQQWLNPYYWNIELAMRYLIPKTQNVICISSYLERYYHARKCNTIITRPLVDVDSFLRAKKSNIQEGLVLSYTGSPGKKDLFNHFLEAVLQLNEEGLDAQPIRLHVAGIEASQLLQYDACTKRKYNVVPPYIHALGYVSTDEAWSVTRSAHFSLLLRDSGRVATAGFPTKIVESLAMGTPVIANHSSDLSQFLIHEQNSLVCSDFTVAELKAKIEMALLLSQNTYEEWSEAATKTARKSLDYKEAALSLKQFINRIKIIK